MNYYNVQKNIQQRLHCPICLFKQHQTHLRNTSLAKKYPHKPEKNEAFYRGGKCCNDFKQPLTQP